MNDFTKEELIHLSVILNVWVATQNHDGTDKLTHKVDSMIDNYCDPVITINDNCPMCKSPMRDTAGLDINNIWAQTCTNIKCDYVNGFKL